MSLRNGISIIQDNVLTNLGRVCILSIRSICGLPATGPRKPTRADTMKKRFFLRIFFPGALLCIVLLAISCDSDQLWTSTNEISQEAKALLLAMALQKTTQSGPYHIIVDATSFPSGYSITLRNGFQYLHITTSGTFPFPYGLADGAFYSVSVSSGPFPADGTGCSISPSGGVISAADATVTLSCWTP